LQAHVYLLGTGIHTLVPVQTTADTTLKKIESFFILKQYFVIVAHSDHVFLRMYHFTKAAHVWQQRQPCQENTGELNGLQSWLTLWGRRFSLHSATLRQGSQTITPLPYQVQKIGHYGNKACLLPERRKTLFILFLCWLWHNCILCIPTQQKKKLLRSLVIQAIPTYIIRYYKGRSVDCCFLLLTATCKGLQSYWACFGLYPSSCMWKTKNLTTFRRLDLDWTSDWD
jgi:hypothetical protein